MIFDRFRKKNKEESASATKSDFSKKIPVPNPKLRVEKDQNNEITLILQIDAPKEEKDTEKRIERRRPKIRILSASTPKSRQKKIHLDTLGSIVWELCDGKRSIKEIAKYLCEKYKLLPSEAEISLNLYFNNLAKRGLVELVIPQDSATKTRKITEENKK